jgi:spore coat polysaccharide biosynthesis protein SpsF (cytidylyltransferase family)
MKIKKVNGFITVRSSSSRLSKKCFLDFFGVTVLEHVVLRCKLGDINPIICTTYNKKDDKIVKIAKKLKIKYFRGPENNKILRWLLCCKKFKLKHFHTVDADDLFFDWTAVKNSFNELIKKKKDIIFPSLVSNSGGASEGYSISKKCLQKIMLMYPFLKNKNYNAEMIESFTKNNEFNCGIFKGMPYEIKNARLTLDYKDDYKFFKKIGEYNGNFSHRKSINNFLKNNLNLLKINFHKNIVWKSRQIKIIDTINI